MVAQTAREDVGSDVPRPDGDYGGVLTQLRRQPSAIELAREKLRQASTDTARSEATAELRQALEDYFDQDMESRQKSLDDIRQRLVGNGSSATKA